MGNDKYVFASDTSMATPIISGICALILSFNPDLTFKEVKNIL